MRGQSDADKMVISEDSRITIGILVICASVVAFLAFVQFQGNANSKAIEGMQKDAEAITRIDLKLAVQGARLEVLIEEFQRMNRNQGGKRK